MGFLDSLKNLIPDFSGKIDLSNLRQLLKDSCNIQFFSNNKVEHHHHYDESTKTVNLNLAKLTPEERIELGKICRDSIKEDDCALIESDSSDHIDSIKEEESSGESALVIEFFQGKASVEDIRIIRAALYLRKRFNEGKRVDLLKHNVIQKHGERGSNIVNLCTAGYFEEYMIPFYSALSKEFGEEVALGKFRKFFSRIVSELPFTIFVSRKMRVQDVRKAINAKVEMNKKYGMKFLNIHGIGAINVDKINETIFELEKSKAIRNIRIDKKKEMISVRVEF